MVSQNERTMSTRTGRCVIVLSNGRHLDLGGAMTGFCIIEEEVDVSCQACHTAKDGISSPITYYNPEELRRNWGVSSGLPPMRLSS